LKNKPKNKQRGRTALRGQQGFTLLEVLLAVMILGLSIVAILQQFSVALRAGSTSQDVTRAVLHAKEKLEELKIKKNPVESSESGSFDDGCSWQTHVGLYQLPAIEGESTSEEKLKHDIFQLTATIAWKTGEQEKQIELTTLKTAKKKQWEE
jgi:type II secretion system protein I